MVLLYLLMWDCAFMMIKNITYSEKTNLNAVFIAQPDTNCQLSL